MVIHCSCLTGYLDPTRGALSEEEQLRFADWVSEGGILIVCLNVIHWSDKHNVSWTFQFGVALGEFRFLVGSWPYYARRSNTSRHDLLTGVYEISFGGSSSKTFTLGPAEVHPFSPFLLPSLPPFLSLIREQRMTPWIH